MKLSTPELITGHLQSTTLEYSFTLLVFCCSCCVNKQTDCQFFGYCGSLSSACACACVSACVWASVCVWVFALWKNHVYFWQQTWRLAWPPRQRLPLLPLPFQSPLDRLFDVCGVAKKNAGYNVHACLIFCADWLACGICAYMCIHQVRVYLRASNLISHSAQTDRHRQISIAGLNRRNELTNTCITGIWLTIAR